MTAAATAGEEEIWVRGAHEHNLQDVDVRIPRDLLVVITGLSGSGKSSLAFDTIYAEGQRRYVESLSTYARQFLEQMARPRVESIDGLSPAIAIEQKTVSNNPRSTVGTATEIGDYLRLLYARVGQPYCWRCSKPISSQSVDQMAERVLALPPETRVQILAPVVRGRKGESHSRLLALRRQGFVRVRIDGVMHDLAEDIKLSKQARHDIDVVVDRLVVRPSSETRLHDSITTALQLSEGFLKLDVGDLEDDGEQWLFSDSDACVDCGLSFPEISPSMFSFNNPHGACELCSGLGVELAFDPELIVPDPALSLAEGAIEPWRASKSPYYGQLQTALAEHFEVDLDTPWRDLPARARDGILLGTPEAGEMRFELTRGGRRESLKRKWDGVVGELERRSEGAGGELARFRAERPCPECGGARLRVEARHVKIAELAIHELCQLPIAELRRFFERLELDGTQRVIADRILSEIRERLAFLANVGLDYLTLDRPSASLSGGEGQRIRLATQIGSALMGVLYILDEPSIGLHQRDNRRLIASLQQLRDMGNSVLVVEHDEETIRAADHVIDMGPGAGVEGGRVVAEGSPAELAQNEASLTGAFLAGRRVIPVPSQRRVPGKRVLTLTGCSEHNLKSVTLRIPLGLLILVTGVSGSGKSSLINDTLGRVLAARLHGARSRAGRFERITGIELVDKVIAVDQSPIGRTPRSNPATYTGAFDGIRQLFATVPEARVRGYGAGRFSFNVKGGRCEACGGDGILRVEMHFLPDLFVTCEICSGRRYNRETLEITYKGVTIADVLEMTVEQALDVMQNVPSISRPLRSLHAVGLGYIRVGQPATTLSGGEAQRIKLARELAKRSTGRTLYLLDEPTTGLHFADVETLLGVLGRLVDKGNTVIVIEHQLDVIKSADYVIDLGPEGGEAGGEIVAEGTPEEVAKTAGSHTGEALARVLR